MQFQRAALNKVLLLKKLICSKPIWFQLNAVIFSVWLSSDAFDPPPPRSIVLSLLLSLPLELNEVGPQPLICSITVEWLFMFDVIASDVYGITFDMPSHKGASPSGCASLYSPIWFYARGELPERFVGNRLSRTKTCCRTPADSQRSRVFDFPLILIRGAIAQSFCEVVCQVEWNVTYSIWPRYWILQKSSLQARGWCKTYFDSKLNLNLTLTSDKPVFTQAFFTHGPVTQQSSKPVWCQFRAEVMFLQVWTSQYFLYWTTCFSCVAAQIHR